MSLKIHPYHPRTEIKNGFATVAASPKYGCPSLFEKIFFGSNYRREWTTAVTIPVFDIKKTNFRIVEMGGGQQTTSLELLDEENREWALRSVDKDVKSNDKISGNALIRAIVQDHISAAYPYAGLSMYDISVAAGIPAGEQYLYFVPEDTAFGKYRLMMANKVFILVNKQPQKEKGITTEEMLVKLRSGKQCYVDTEQYLKARLLDWLVGDWDRHDDQWRWIEKETNSGIAFCAVPRDRDQAFFKSDGLLTKFIGLFFMPHIDKFNKNVDDLFKEFVKRGRDISDKSGVHGGPIDQTWDMREFYVEDPDHNTLRFGQVINS